jgi:hypothetical protein
MARDVFQFLSAQVWALVVSNYCFSSRGGLRMYRALQLCCKASRVIAQSEIVAQSLTSILAVHLGFARVSFQRQPNPVLCMQRPAELIQIRSETAVRLGARVSTTDAASLVWTLDVPATSAKPGGGTDLVRHGLYNKGTFSSWRERLMFLFFVASARCCVCAKAECRCLNESRDVEKGFFFFFAPEVATNIEARTWKWAGLRICTTCVVMLGLKPQPVQLPPRAPSSKAGQATGVRRDRQEESAAAVAAALPPHIGLVTELPLDVSVGGKFTQSASQSRILGVLAYVPGSRNERPAVMQKMPDPLGVVATLNRLK